MPLFRLRCRTQRGAQAETRQARQNERSDQLKTCNDIAYDIELREKLFLRQQGRQFRHRLRLAALILIAIGGAYAAAITLVHWR